VDTTLFDVDFADSLNGVASGADVILFTSDGGQSWHRTSVGIEEGTDTDRHGRTRTAKLAVASPVTRFPITISADGSGWADGTRGDEFESSKAQVLKSGREMDGKDGTRMNLRIYDGEGRELRDFTIHHSPFTIQWDGSDDQGRPVPSGIYIVRLSPGASEISKKILYVKE
jgi:hypothetical protein